MKKKALILPQIKICTRVLAARLAPETSLTVINLCRQGEVPVFGPDRLVAHQHLEALVYHLTNLLHPGRNHPISQPLLKVHLCQGGFLVCLSDCLSDFKQNNADKSLVWGVRVDMWANERPGGGLRSTFLVLLQHSSSVISYSWDFHSV